ncbi:hypothetical protein [Taibaiella koreensis]|uniref:hypothetical protein n=1 Tax=Taibaiella koreensis TaxID=1268548 RepID=UPI000E59B874|nr:hypothetical protein [Taibaiella koreensis]
MEHFFDLLISYKQQELLLKARLVTFAYTYKFFVIVDGIELVFERDDEHSFRVLSPQVTRNEMADKELAEKIIDALELVQF